jgi:hypothetical protein
MSSARRELIPYPHIHRNLWKPVHRDTIKQEFLNKSGSEQEFVETQ